MRIHLRAPTGTRIEETTKLTTQVEQKIRSIIPPDRVESVVNNIGLPVSGINLSYQNTGTIGVFDADMLVTLRDGPTPTDTYVKTLREQLPKAFPGTTFSFLPADIVSQILNFGSPAPLDVQIAGSDLKAIRAFATKLYTKICQVPGIADPRIQEAFQDPALKVDFNREFAGVVGLTENDASTSLQTTLSGSTQTAPTYWLSPTWRLLPSLGSDPAIWHRHAWRPEICAVEDVRIRPSFWAAWPLFRRAAQRHRGAL